MTLVFERLAQKRYGNANLGVVLRQLNLERVGIKEGSVLFTPSEISLRRILIRPLSHVLRITEEQHALFVEMVEATTR